jgi:hypothetical protein
MVTIRSDSKQNQEEGKQYPGRNGFAKKRPALQPGVDGSENAAGSVFRR